MSLSTTSAALRRGDGLSLVGPMQLDATTLIVAGSFVAVLTGLLLVGARTQIAG